MDDRAALTGQFETHRSHLLAVAYRMLGSLSEAEDAVQESWLHVSRANTNEVENLRAWLTTVVARVCLDMMRSRKARREEPLDGDRGEPGAAAAALLAVTDPALEAQLADSVGLAMLVVLDRLAPTERLAFVMHDMFGVPFDEIAAVIGRSPAAARQIASRARRRVHGGPAAKRGDLARQRHTVDAFLAALRAGDFNALLAVLDPDVVVRAEPTAVPPGLPTEIRGAETSAELAIKLSRGARFARRALVDGGVGVVVAPRGRLVRALRLTFADGKIAQIEVVAAAATLRRVEVAVLEA